jgi:hypothetical protein
MPKRTYTGPVGPKAGGVDVRIPGVGVVVLPTDGTPVDVTDEQAKALDASGLVATPKATKATPATSEED